MERTRNASWIIKLATLTILAITTAGCLGGNPVAPSEGSAQIEAGDQNAPSTPIWENRSDLNAP